MGCSDTEQERGHFYFSRHLIVKNFHQMYFKLIESFVKDRHKFPKSLEIFPCHLIDILMIIFF